MNSCGPLFAVVRFEGVEHPWLWLALLLVGAGLLVSTYRVLFRRLDRRLFATLLVLRSSAIVALILALAKPTWTRESDEVDPGHLAVVVDNSASMSLADPSGRARYSGAVEGVDRLRRALGRSGPPIVLDLFDIDGTPFEGKALPARPTAERTDLARAINEPLARLRSKPLAGLVVISDGNDNTGRQDFRELANLPVPIMTVGFRADSRAVGLDLAVRKVRAPERAMVNNEIKVDVTLAKTGGATTSAKVVVKRGRETFATRKIALDAGDSEQVVSLTMTPREPGTFVLTASAEAGSGERRLSNNAEMFPLRVDAEPIRVLYLEGFLRYEYKFLKDRLEDDPDVSLVSIVRRANPDRADPANAREGLSAETLKRFDVVILGDMESAFLAASEYQTLAQWLNEKGHALLVLGGYHSFGPDGLRSTPLAEVLPVVFAEKAPFQSEDPFVPELTEEGRRHPIFELSGDRVKDVAAWNAAPPLLGSSLVLRAKPGADVLAVDPSVVIEGKPAVVVAVQRFGAGHTMVLAADTTWRWSRLSRVMGRSDTLYARFWSQTIRWLAGRDLDDKRPLIALSTDRPDYDVARPVTIRVARQPRPDMDLASANLAVEVVGPNGRTVPVPIRAGSAEPDVFNGTFHPPVGGRYEVAASLTAGVKPIANQVTEFLVHGPDLELAETGTNRAQLQAIAASTGGVYVDIGDVEKVADQVPRQGRRVRRIQRAEFWNSPALFLAFLGFVSIEWFLRRNNHLV